MTKTTRFCFVRHGETDWNAQRRYQGQLDVALNATGEWQARALGDALAAHDFAAACTSDLSRAARTAELALGGRCAVSPRLCFRERHYGVFQGLTPDDARTVHPEAHAHFVARSTDYDFETGETLTDFAARVQDGAEAMAREFAGRSVVVFTHGGVLDVLHRLASGRDLAAPRDFAIPNAGINWLRRDDDGWRIDVWGDTRHLQKRDSLDELVR